MLKYRVIFGLLFGALFIGLIFLDSACSQGWPLGAFSTPPGAFVALGCVVVIPFGLREMGTLLAAGECEDIDADHGGGDDAVHVVAVGGAGIGGGFAEACGVGGVYADGGGSGDDDGGDGGSG